MSYDLRYLQDDKIEVGIDEAGRGCLFGRMYVGAVILPDELECFNDNGELLLSIRDSKKLTEKKREALYDYIKENAVDYSICWCSNEQIDEENVLQADLNTMHKALDSLSVPVQRILVDGDMWKPWSNKDNKDSENNEEAEVYKIVEGDSKFMAIAAASILAKVERDRWVLSVCDEHPEYDERYGLRSNKGYGTAKHMAGIKEYGVTPLHRISYAPCGGTKKTVKTPWIGI